MTETGAVAFVTAWTPWPPGLVILALVVAPYLLWWRQARARGVVWSGWRAILYLALGTGTLAYSVCGPLHVLRDQVYWAGALQVGVLSCVTPAGLALGDPLRLRALSRGRTAVAIPRGVLGGVLRVLMFPAVSSMLAIGSITVVFFTGYFEASTRSVPLEVVLVVHLVGTGLLFVLPLLVPELLPGWASPGVRALMAFADGLFDAVPGIALMSSGTLLAPGYPGFNGPAAPTDLLMEQHLGGGVLLAVSEVVGLPVLAAVLLEWVRADRREAAVIDTALGRRVVEPGLPASEPDADELWWRSDPRFADRWGSNNARTTRPNRAAADQVRRNGPDNPS